VVSTPLKDYLESVGVPPGKCIVMPNGVDQIKFNLKPKNLELMTTLGIPPEATVIGFTGILRPWHGLEMLVEAVQRLAEAGKQVFLLIVGDGPIRDGLNKELLAAGLGAYSKITGRVSHEHVAEYVNLLDIAVSPKATFYASPMKILEYMALGKAVVAPDTANLRDMIDNGANGVLFEKDSVDSLATCLFALIDSPKLQSVIGREAREKVEKRLNWEWNAKEVCRLVIETQAAMEVEHV
jgi:glycosyltransferase involved in cell wall biosynthesis